MSRKRKNLTVYEKQKILKLKEDGLTHREIASMVGCSSSTVSRVVNEPLVESDFKVWRGESSQGSEVKLKDNSSDLAFLRNRESAQRVLDYASGDAPATGDHLLSIGIISVLAVVFIQVILYLID